MPDLSTVPSPPGGRTGKLGRLEQRPYRSALASRFTRARVATQESRPHAVPYSSKATRTNWRAAEEVEQQVAIPIEIAMNGIPHLAHLRSTSLFGLSSLTLVFDDESENDWNRQKVLERIAQATLPTGLQPQIGTDWSPVGQIYFYTLQSTNPKYDLVELKSLQDWVLAKQFKSVPNVVDVSIIGGATREYQVRLDPENWFPTG